MGHNRKLSRVDGRGGGGGGGGGEEVSCGVPTPHVGEYNFLGSMQVHFSLLVRGAKIGSIRRELQNRQKQANFGADLKSKGCL